MPIVFNEALQEDLCFLAAVGPEVVTEFLAVCLDAVENGIKKGMFVRAASALGVAADQVAGAVMGLTECFLLAAKVRACRDGRCPRLCCRRLRSRVCSRL
jgi:hypothetical protein